MEETSCFQKLGQHKRITHKLNPLYRKCVCSLGKLISLVFMFTYKWAGHFFFFTHEFTVQLIHQVKALGKISFGIVTMNL